MIVERGAVAEYDPMLFMAGLIEAEFVEVPDGWYEYRVEAGQVKARWYSPGDDGGLDVALAEVTTFGEMQARYIPLPHPVPRYRKELRWRWT